MVVGGVCVVVEFIYSVWVLGIFVYEGYGFFECVLVVSMNIL